MSGSSKSGKFPFAQLNVPESTTIPPTAVPWPRGVRYVDGKLYALARGAHRSAGGPQTDIDDLAGTIFVIDPGEGPDFSRYEHYRDYPNSPVKRFPPARCTHVKAGSELVLPEVLAALPEAPEPA